jgi:hypothetical protein
MVDGADIVYARVWNIPGARNVINPLKLFIIGWHELCLAAVRYLLFLSFTR